MPTLHREAPRSLRGALERLAADIRRETAAEVSLRGAELAAYSTDSSNYRQLPLAVVAPRSREEIPPILRACAAAGAPVLSRGCGTSLAGQTTNAAVVIDTSKHLRGILEVDLQGRTATVEPGVVRDQLNEHLADHHLEFGPDTSTHAWATFGGMLGNNSCGAHSLRCGRTVDNTLAMTIALADGTVLDVGPTPDDELDRRCRRDDSVGRLYRELRVLRDEHEELIRGGYPDIPRKVSGFNLEYLLPEHGFDVAKALVGTEGTCAMILSATVQLVPSLAFTSLTVLGYDRIDQAGDDVPRVRGYDPTAIEGVDDILVEFMLRKHLHAEDVELFPPGRGWLVVEFAGASQDEADAKARRLEQDSLARDDRITARRILDPEHQHQVWQVRESGLAATAHVPAEPEAWPGWEDSAVAPERLGDYLRVLRGLYADYGYKAALYGHFGQGLVHTRIPFDLRTPKGVADFRRFMYQAAERCAAMGGTLTGEHGDGQARGELLPILYDQELVRCFERFREAFDPEGRMNPGKVVHPNPLDQDLRLGPTYRPEDPPVHFAYQEDGGSFAHATMRCVGVGKCRRTHGGTMCPSYQVTREEIHSTRGRARVLFEMLGGSLREDGWRSEEVERALDLCLSCKACADECPVGVDMATYKAEFLAHHYRGRLRPRHAYAMGWIHRWARIGSLVPGLANAVTRWTPSRKLLAKAAGMTTRRPFPAFAGETFRAWFERTRAERDDKAVRRPVLLWPDTFTNHFDPAPAKAAVRVLHHAGYRVDLPPPRLCCGRPLYDYGMLDLARRLLERDLRALRPAIDRGIPLVGIEPSCIAVFRDELPKLMPTDEDARRLRRSTWSLGEFLAADDDWQPPTLAGETLYHGHCHQRAVLGTDRDLALLERAGVEAEELDSGCCGLAGSFGFEAGHYQISVDCGERVLAPRVREAGHRRVIADGFSCRTQVEHLTGRRPQHLAEVLAAALPEAAYTDQPPAR